MRLVKGSHIVVRRLFDHDRAYIFQNADGRIVFAIPYERDFTLIGTTDVDYHGDPGEIAPDDEAEIAYLLAAASEYFRRAGNGEAMVWAYSGVRPLYDDGASRPRRRRATTCSSSIADGGRAPLLSVFGGKITTYRRLAEHALEWLGRYLKIGPKWTAKAQLPGGHFPVDGFDDVDRRAPRGLSLSSARRMRAGWSEATARGRKSC